MNATETPGNGNDNSDHDKPIQLYLARFEEGTGTLILAQDGEQGIRLHGEVVIVSSGFGEQGPVIDALQRLAVWTDSIRELEGVLSMGGSAEKFMAEPATSGELAPLDMRIYYPLLSQLEPALVESDAVYPQLEVLRGRMLWQLGDTIDEKSFIMQIEVVLDEPMVAPLGAIKQVSLAPIVLTFVRLEEAGAGRAPTHRSLIACTSSTLNPTGSEPYYELRLRFVNLSSRTIPQLEGTAAQPGIIQQLVDRACDVWWAKGGIKIVPDNSSIFPPPPTWGGGAVSAGQELSLRTMQASLNAVEVYLVDQLTDRPGGGITHDSGTDNAFVIIDVGKAERNKLVLAHEAGHVLGLSHPDGTGGLASKIGSTCSVMVVDKPNSSRNTSNNLTLIAGPIGMVLQTVGTGGWQTDDNYEHYIRDFPYDDGVEASVPQPPAQYWWTHSDVWNSNKAPSQFNTPNNPPYYDGDTVLIFDQDDNFPYTDISLEPTYAGPNYMYVRLRARDFGQPVNVYLFLAVPGSANEPLILLPVPSPRTNPLVFSSSDFPVSGAPVMKYVPWNVPQDPIQPNPPPNPAQLYPRHCCVFAVAYSTNEPAATEPPPHIIDIINDVLAHPNNSQYRFYHLHSRLASDNDVAQRNLNFQGTAPGSPASGSTALPWSMFAWVQMDNPFEEPAVARLDVDAIEALGLEGLTLEVNDEIVGDIKVGEQTSVMIADALQPGEDRVLRIRATLPQTVPLGSTFPIHLKFIVKDELVSGYTHILRIVSLGEALLQVLDLVFGSMRAVAVGCESELAQFVANRTLQTLLRERARRSPGCFGFFWRFIRPKNAWRSELANLAIDISTVAQSLMDRSEPECQVVSKRLNEFSELLNNSKDTQSAVFIEQIRNVADHIQEPASRLGRKQFKA